MLATQPESRVLAAQHWNDGTDLPAHLESLGRNVIEGCALAYMHPKLTPVGAYDSPD